MSYPHWNYFLAIESELWETTRYVELSSNNYSTYSIEFAKILMNSCSEIDSVAKLICQELDKTNRPPGVSQFNPEKTNIDDYCKRIAPVYSKFCDFEIEIPQYSLPNLKPWENWRPGSQNSPGSPFWWRAYNDVKHDMDKNFAKANLENALNAVAGLMVMTLYYHNKVHPQHLTAFDITQSPKIMFPKWYGNFQGGSSSWVFSLPE
jgi:hypothetical protein